MDFLAEEIEKNLKLIDAKAAGHESLSEYDLKVLLLNLLKIEDSHETE